jgi:hypothetical protein
LPVRSVIVSPIGTSSVGYTTGALKVPEPMPANTSTPDHGLLASVSVTTSGRPSPVTSPTAMPAVPNSTPPTGTTLYVLRLLKRLPDHCIRTLKDSPFRTAMSIRPSWLKSELNSTGHVSASAPKSSFRAYANVWAALPW